MNKNNMSENVLSINRENKNGEVLYVYANQWRFRSAKGLVPAITYIFLNSLTRVNHESFTIPMHTELIWKLLNRVCNALFGRVIRSYRKIDLERCNDVNSSTESVVKS